MTLLFDHNLSPRLVTRLADSYPDATHPSLVGLARASDEEVWEYAHANDRTIVTKDADFSDILILRGTPPKVIWLRLGNCSTTQVEMLLRLHHAAIQDFLSDPASGILTLQTSAPESPRTSVGG